MERYVKWKEVHEYLFTLEKKLKEDKNFDLEKCPGIFTFPRGGLILATLLSYLIDKPILDNPHPECIIIDDIADTGITMKKYSDLKDKKNYYITTMFIHEDQLSKKSEYLCQVDYYYDIKQDDWVVYPWEDMNHWD